MKATRVELEPQSVLTGDVVYRLSGTLTCGGTDMDLTSVTVLNEDLKEVHTRLHCRQRQRHGR